MYMKQSKIMNKKYVLNIIFLGCSLLQQNLYAGFFDQLGQGLKQTLSGQAAQQKAAPAEVKPQKVVLPTATVKKTVNVRSGPGTSHAKVGQVNPDSIIRIVNSQGDWLQIETDTSKGLLEGWLYKPLATINLAYSHSVATAAAPSKNTRSSQQIYYAGYSKEFQTVKNMMSTGDLKGVDKFYTDRETTVLKNKKSKWQAIQEIGLLRWMERGTLYLDEGNLDKSVKSFANAENILNVRQQDSKASDFLGSITAFAAESVTGNEEFQEYPGEGYEKVLMLNYKSIAFLLNGERKAYNVARRAIDWQNMERALFRDRIEAAKKEAKKEADNKLDKNGEGEKTADNSADDWSKSYKALDKIAAKVPSAFVNPFGYYVTGMISEYESRSDRSLRDNARIAYKKALELNPGSQVLKQAVKDMKNRKTAANRRLLHVVVADGFVPEKKMLVYNFSTGNGVVPIKLPIYEPVASRVARIEVQTMKGKRLAKLSPVADIEAICLRQQKDSEAFRSVRMGIAMARAIGVNQASKGLGIFGSLLSSTANDMAAPDMRSWMSLPATLQAARLNISKKIKKLKIVSYDAKGRRLASRTVNVSNNSDAFIYARSIDRQLYAHASKPLWIADK